MVQPDAVTTPGLPFPHPLNCIYTPVTAELYRYHEEDIFLMTDESRIRTPPDGPPKITLMVPYAMIPCDRIKRSWLLSCVSASNLRSHVKDTCLARVTLVVLARGTHMAD